jgi:hypothetical protein
MEIRVGEKLAQNIKKAQMTPSKKIDCGRMLVNVG